MKLLTINNTKTLKGEAKGYMTAVLHLAPFTAAGINVCPMAELAGCAAGCLNTAGRGGIAKGRAVFNPHGTELPDNVIQRARVKRTRFYAEDREGFMRQLYVEIKAFTRKAERKGLIPAVRLNGTSDISWETIPMPVDDESEGIHMIYTSVFHAFPEVQFYDYTKVPNRFKRELPSNYHLSVSYSEASPKYAAMASAWTTLSGANLVVVFDTKRGEALPESFQGRTVIDGDETDLRFLDPKGVVVGLRAKGAARKDTSGFVIPHDRQLEMVA